MFFFYIKPHAKEEVKGRLLGLSLNETVLFNTNMTCDGHNHVWETDDNRYCCTFILCG